MDAMGSPDPTPGVPPYRAPPPGEPEPASPPPDVGALRSVHSPPPLVKALVGPVAIGAIVGGVVWALGAPVFVGVPGTLLVIALLAFSPLRLRGVRVELHAGGLVLFRGDERSVVPFSEVNETWFE